MMNDPDAVAAMLEQVFSKIHLQQMWDIPILNAKIRVQALGFQEYKGRMLGVIITPWMMSLVLLPGVNDDWLGLKLGRKEVYEFPAKPCQFVVNEFDEIGKCQTHSLYSPMNSFACHEQAVTAAQRFIDQLLVAAEPTDEAIVDEQLLSRILRGEEVLENNPRIGPQLTRRDVLHGKFNVTSDCAG